MLNRLDGHLRLLRTAYYGVLHYSAPREHEHSTPYYSDVFGPPTPTNSILLLSLLTTGRRERSRLKAACYGVFYLGAIASQMLGHRSEMTDGGTRRLYGVGTAKTSCQKPLLRACWLRVLNKEEGFPYWDQPMYGVCTEYYEVPTYIIRSFVPSTRRWGCACCSSNCAVYNLRKLRTPYALVLVYCDDGNQFRAGHSLQGKIVLKFPQREDVSASSSTFLHTLQITVQAHALVFRCCRSYGVDFTGLFWLVVLRRHTEYTKHIYSRDGSYLIRRTPYWTLKVVFQSIMSALS